ncbi:porin [Ramlibacter sp.]|uniref:porin n=1 Tax=Ramlibacter sp. TaxID=1917967 RepID=UPI0017B202F6|nr:porin [Ramlibacter sp.]MBA2673800.1 porin [Ramlibacter sp.]
MKTKRITPALAAGMGLLCSAGAFAQSSVTLYGIVDTGIERASNGAGISVNRLVSGQGSSSRLGFRGTEDLGGGMRAIFNLEAGVNTDNGSGAAAGGGLMFNRQSWVGLAGDWGQITFGRQFRPEARAVFGMDPFDAGSVASPPNTYSNTGFRADNAIIYETPRMGGFVGRVMYALGENAGGVSGALNDVGASLQYYNGPLYAAYGYDSQRNAAATDRRTWHTVGGSYDFGAVKLYGAYRTRKEGAAALDQNSYWIGVGVPVGPVLLQATVGRVNDKTAANRDTKGYSFGAEYLLSKRTDLYMRYGKLRNQNGATFNLDNGVNGPSPSSFVVGVRHRF